MTALSGSKAELITLIPLAAWIFFCIFITTGSVVAFRAKKNRVTFLMLLSSLLTLAGSIAYLVITYKLMQYLNEVIHSTSESNFNVDQMEQIQNYYYIVAVVTLSSLLIFAFTFVIFCCNIANIRQRNEQLEVLCQEIATSKNASKNKA